MAQGDSRYDSLSQQVSIRVRVAPRNAERPDMPLTDSADSLRESAQIGGYGTIRPGWALLDTFP
jgi:hypothetical protein